MSETTFPGDDTWGPTCSYCGSISPAEFFTLVESGASIGPTDKNYKAYVDVGPHQKKFYFQHLDADDRRRFIELYNSKRMKLGYPGYFYARPYFVTEVRDVDRSGS